MKNRFKNLWWSVATNGINAQHIDNETEECRNNAPLIIAMNI